MHERRTLTITAAKANVDFKVRSDETLQCVEGSVVPNSASVNICYLFDPLVDTPSQRVQFILGTEDDDLEHVPHDLFTELDELSFRDGRATEWRETARSGRPRESNHLECPPVSMSVDVNQI